MKNDDLSNTVITGGPDHEIEILSVRGLAGVAARVLGRRRSTHERILEWATDEMLANFFQVICPFVYEMECITYFALTRGKHSHTAVARIRDTTQVLVDSL